MPNAGSRSHGGRPSTLAPYVNTAMSESAIQNEGAAYAAVVSTVSARSTAVPRRTACTTPSGTPIRNVRTIDVAPSASDTGSAARRTSRTGRRVAKLVPRSPLTTAPAQCAYWTTIGRSSPSSVRTRAASSALAVGGTRNAAGSPGARRTRANTSVTTSHMSNIACSSRRASMVQG